MPPASFFQVNLAWSAGLFTASAVKISGNTAVLTLAHRANADELVQTRYEFPADTNDNRLRDLAGNKVSTPHSSFERNGRSYWGTKIITVDNLTLP